MIRLALVLAVVGLGAPPLEAAPRTNQSAAKKSTKKSTKKSKKSAKKSAKKSRRKRGKKSRAQRAWSRHVVSARVYDGLPPGFVWPPSPAMRDANARCERALDRLGVRWEAAEPLGRIAGPIVVRDRRIAGVTYTNTWGAKASTTMDCQLALAFARLGPELRALGVAEVKYGGIYELSYIRTPRGRTLSRHAIGMAMDIISFVDDTGRELRVDRTYRQGEALVLDLEQLFLTNGTFHNVITPRNDPVGHSDHFHVEAIASFEPAPAADDVAPASPARARPARRTAADDRP